MSVDEQRMLVERSMAKFNVGDLEGYLELYDESAILHGYEGVEPGREGIRKFYEGFMKVLTDGRVILEDVIAQDGRLAFRFTFSANHSGEFMGVPATGKRVTLTGITILRFRNGSCVERWTQADFPGLMQQLGA